MHWLFYVLSSHSNAFSDCTHHNAPSGWSHHIKAVVVYAFFFRTSPAEYIPWWSNSDDSYDMHMYSLYISIIHLSYESCLNMPSRHIIFCKQKTSMWQLRTQTWKIKFNDCQLIIDTPTKQLLLQLLFLIEINFWPHIRIHPSLIAQNVVDD